MSNKTDRSDLRRPLGIAALIALAIGILFLAPFFGVIVTSIVLAFTFAPINRWFAKRTKRPNSAPALTLLTALLMVVIPLLAVISITVMQTRTLANELQDVVKGVTVDRDMTTVATDVSQVINTFSGGAFTVTEQQVVESVSAAGVEIANGLLRLLTGLIGSIPAIITSIVLFIYIFLAVLRYQKEILRFIKRLNPLGDEVYELFTSKAGAMTNGMVRGQFLIALAQGTIGTLTFAIAGVPYLGFFFLLLTFLSIIPLGSGIISLPVSVVLLLMGNIWQGLVVLLGHLLIVGNIDNVLRPVLIPREARLPAALVLIGVFAGLAMFGFLGLFIGPVLLILILTTLEVYAASKETRPSAKAARS
jgi:predicted PurR-regulated permease PerM